MYLHARAKFSPDRYSDFEAFTRFVEGTIPRSIHICMPNLVMIGPAVWPLIVDTHARTHTHTHTRARACNIIVYYIDIDRYLIIDPTSYRPIMLIYYYFILLNIYRECVRANSCSVLCNKMFSRIFESLPLKQTKLPYRPLSRKRHCNRE